MLFTEDVPYLLGNFLKINSAPASNEEWVQIINQELSPKVPSMSFYPDFIQILTRFYPDFIQILFRFYPDFIQILSRFYPDFIQIF